MDEKALNELLECSVCLDRLDSSSKVLPCQHTFCRWCLEEIVTTKKELRCPECRCLVEINVSELPTNILLMRLLEGMKNAARSSGSSTKSSPSRVSDKTGSGPTSPTHCSAEGGSQSPVHKITITDISNQPCAKALYSYDATEPGDLSFKKSDIILLRKQVDENWYHGEINGKHGFFPATYVQIFNNLSNKEVPSCKALYDFTDQNEKDCLTFQKDVKMTVIRRVDDNWVEGKLGETIGIFPKSFVQLNDAAKLLLNFQASLVKSNQSQTNDLNNQTRNHPVPSHPNLSASMSASITSTSSDDQSPSTSAPSQPIPPRPVPSPGTTVIVSTSSHQTKPNNLSISHRSSHKRHSLNLNSLSPARTSPPQMPNRHSMEVPGSVVVSSVSSDTTCTNSEMVPSSPRTCSHNSTTEGNTSLKTSVSIFMSLYSYKPQKDDEMDLQKGEFYSVTEKCQDGWYKGVCLRSGKSGVFPGNYVQPVKMTPSKSGGIGISRSPPCVSAAIKSVSVCSTSSTLSPSSSSSTTSAIVGVSSTAPVAVVNSMARLGHVNVTRTHSFPKTSPLSSVDYHARLRAQGIIRSGVFNHPRPITNITQAQIRSTQSSGQMTVAQSRAHSMLIPTTCVMATGASSPHCGAATGEHEDENKTQSLPTGISAQQAYHNSQVVLRAISASGNKHSPRSSRRHTHADKCSKHSSSANQNSTPSRHNYVGSSTTVQPKISTTDSCIVPPNNVVIGATGGIPVAKDKDKKKERLPVSLMKKLSAGMPLRVRKSKSPNPDNKDSGAAAPSRHTHSQVAAPEAAAASAAVSSRSACKSSTQSPNHHHRSGSAPLEASPSRGTVTSPTHTSSHKKSSCVDSSHHNNGKPAKVKPLVRERYRCILPYPPQSDLELELKLGDVVYVYKKRDDGWFKGTLQGSGKTGLFPGNFVEKC